MESFKFQTSLRLFKDNLWDYHILVPDEISEHLITEDRRVLCSINNAEHLHVALMPDGNGSYFINLNKEVRKKHHLEEGSEMQVVLAKDLSKYGLPVPDFFEELCFQDPEANDFFHALTMGKQRNLLYIIGKPKSEQKQLEKALTIFEYLKSTNGQLDFKELNLALKNSRFKQ